MADRKWHIRDRRSWRILCGRKRAHMSVVSPGTRRRQETTCKACWKRRKLVGRLGRGGFTSAEIYAAIGPALVPDSYFRLP